MHRFTLHLRTTRLVFVVAFLLALGTSTDSAFARVKLGEICKPGGMSATKLTGLGLVVGLSGTGDGGDNLPTVRSLAATLQNMGYPVSSLLDLSEADNVAIVLIEATVPATGLHKGQRLDCHVSSFLGAKSLRGGRLMLTPMRLAALKNDFMIGLASGAIIIEDPTSPTTARVAGGIHIEYDVPATFAGQNMGGRVSLLINPSHAGFTTASEIARVINREFSYASASAEEALAKAVSPGVVEVRIPDAYAGTPVDFISVILETGIEQPNTQAKVVVNTRTETVIVTGEVEISPVVISHRNLSIEVGPPGAFAGSSFVAVPPLQQDDPAALGASPVKLRELVEALNQLRVPTSDVIEILRELKRSGKLHASYEEY